MYLHAKPITGSLLHWNNFIYANNTGTASAHFAIISGFMPRSRTRSAHDRFVKCLLDSSS